MNLDPVWPALIASAGSIVTGFVSAHFKLFIEPDENFRKRVDRRRKELTEQYAMRLVALLKHVKSMTPDDVLRGDGHEEPDLVGDACQECHKLITVLHRLEMIRAIVKLSYSVLLGTIVLGGVGILLSGLWSESRPYIFWIAILLLFFQVCLVLCVMRASAILERYEDV